MRYVILDWFHVDHLSERKERERRDWRHCVGWKMSENNQPQYEDLSEPSSQPEDSEVRHASSNDVFEDRRAKMNALFGFRPWSVRISKPAVEKPPRDTSEGMQNGLKPLFIRLASGSCAPMRC
jgi:hypothetical protein